jgi:hypothetical protein
MRRLPLLVAACLLLAPSSIAHAIEIQAWDSDPNFSPSQQHIHATDTLTQFQRISGTTQFQVTVLLHNSTAHINWVRWGCESSVKQYVPVNWQGTGAHEERFGPVTLSISPSQCPGLYREIRVTANADRIPLTNNRAFTTTRTCLQMGTSGTNYCGGPTQAGRCGGGAWYEATEYSIARVDCRDVATMQSRPLRPGVDTIRVDAQAGSVFAHIDPGFHAFNPGIAVVSNGGTSWRTFTVPAGLAPGPHKLVVRDRRTNGEEGVAVFGFVV